MDIEEKNTIIDLCNYLEACSTNADKKEEELINRSLEILHKLINN